jgi:cardiolipin synthase
MLSAIAAAQKSLRLEMYIFAKSPLGLLFRDFLVAAGQRGVRVEVLVDSVGSIELADDFWQPLRQAGGKFRWFNPVSLAHWGFRDHRKLLVCDEAVAFVGGFNIAPEYDGNGITQGWCDHGLQITGGLVPELATAFDNMFAKADERHLPFTRFRKTTARRKIFHPSIHALLMGPGRGHNPFKKILLADLKKAQDIRIIAAYFLPPWSVRRALAQAARRGAKVQILLAGKTDVALARLAAQNLYQRLLRAGVQIYEYQPQVLHAKLLIVDEAVYAGSANLDTRSFHINYELMVRLTDPVAAAEAREIYQEDLKHAVKVDAPSWRRTRSFWTKLKERWAYFMLARLDPYIARRQLKTLRS